MKNILYVLICVFLISCTSEIDTFSACDSNQNLMPLIIDAAKSYATLGEIVESMKKVFGDWNETPII